MAVDYGIRTAVDQAPWGGTDYPFAGPSSYALLLNDLYLSYADDLNQFEPPFTLAWVFGLGTLGGGPRPGGVTPAHAIDLLVKDANGAIVFDSTGAAYSSSTWGTNRVVSQWLGSTAVCRIVSRNQQATAFHADEEPAVVLNSRTYRRTPSRLIGVRVDAQIFTGPVRLEAGYNIALAAPPQPTQVDGAQATAVVSLDAVPGAGIGRAPGCADVVPTIRTINQVKGAAGGNFVIQTDDCIRLQVPIATGGEIDLASNCQPCCSCEAFVNTYTGLHRMWDRWQAIATSAEAARDEYVANIDRWKAQADCRAAHPAQLVVVQQDPCGAFIGASFCNTTTDCIAPVTLALSFSTPAIVLGAEMNGTTYAPLVVGSTVSFLMDALEPGQSLAAKLRVRVACNTGDSLTTTLTVGDLPPVSKTSPLNLSPTTLPCVPEA